MTALGEQPDLLRRFGLTPNEFTAAFPSAIEALRGSRSASNQDRRDFLQTLLTTLVTANLATSVTSPRYGDDTVYRVETPRAGSVAIIQKGCPDGAHSATRWSVPDWADEAYLWWLCSSMKSHPGEHVVKGLNRLRQRVLSDPSPRLDGVVFHNDLCGTAHRPCPKSIVSVTVGQRSTPPPCIYLLPASGANSSSPRHPQFPAELLALFGISVDESPAYLGSVSFPRKGPLTRLNVTSGFGIGRSSRFRS